ncbi:MAG: dockerin type I repeat-containing protein, partial [Prevotella sp.]|nr:dockerin type I repeat-containing protein [Prevotella sp.]
TKTHHRLEYFHADNHDYNYYEELFGDSPYYGDDGRNLRLQTTTYPYVDTEGVIHDALTDTTEPAAKLFNSRSGGEKLMGKPITDICEKDGLISFLFKDSNVIPGDVNGDGVVNEKDIVALVNDMMAHSSGTIDLTSADVNHDGMVNVADVVLIASMIISDQVNTTP